MHLCNCIFPFFSQNQGQDFVWFWFIIFPLLFLARLSGVVVIITVVVGMVCGLFSWLAVIFKVFLFQLFHYSCNTTELYRSKCLIRLKIVKWYVWVFSITWSNTPPGGDCYQSKSFYCSIFLMSNEPRPLDVFLHIKTSCVWYVSAMEVKMWISDYVNLLN